MESTTATAPTTEGLTPIAEVIKSSTSSLSPRLAALLQQAQTPESRAIQAEKRKEREEWEQRQKQMQIRRILENANLPKRYLNANVDSYIITEKNQAASVALKNFRDSYYIYGECGTGKTFLACLLMKLVAQDLRQAYLFTPTELMWILNPYRTDTTKPDENKNVKALSRLQVLDAPCLVIDDLGVEKPSAFSNSLIFDVVNHRYNEDLQTIITSNFDILALQKRWGDYEGSRIGRRITSICKPIFLQDFK